MRRSLLSLFSACVVASGAAAFQHPQQQGAQRPMMASSSSSASGSALLLSDSLSSQRSLSIFASLARDDANTSSLMGDGSRYTVVLAPTNAALKRMDHKPWEDPAEVAAQGEGGSQAAYSGGDGMDRAQRNLRRFVRACLVEIEIEGEGEGEGETPEWKAGDRRNRGAGSGDHLGQVWWEQDDHGARTLMPHKIAVEAVVGRVKNGEIWALDGTLEP